MDARLFRVLLVISDAANARFIVCTNDGGLMVYPYGEKLPPMVARFLREHRDGSLTVSGAVYSEGVDNG